MPSVATAATATAAQTSAAGSRMLGFYLGGGGVKVDCTFDTANFLTKDATGDFVASAPVKAGASNTTTGVVALALRYNNGYGGALGSLRSSGDITLSKYCHPSPTTGNAFVSSVDTAASRAALVLGNSTMSLQFGGSTTTPIGEAVTLTNALIVNAGGSVMPGVDNSQGLGASSLRWSVVYAGTGTINTSDTREKTWRGAPSFAELAAARRIAAELGFYRWNDAIAAKGEDGARYHFGVRAQTVWAIMADEGLIDPIVEGETPTSSYAFLCYDEWPEVEAVEEERDEEGNITVEAVEAREAGNRFGIRPDQLALFLIAAQEARLAALETA